MISQGHRAGVTQPTLFPFKAQPCDLRSQDMSALFLGQVQQLKRELTQ